MSLLKHEKDCDAPRMGEQAGHASCALDDKIGAPSLRERTASGSYIGWRLEKLADRSHRKDEDGGRRR